jgi:hypothetical protein
MTHFAHPALSTTKYSSKGKKAPNTASARKAKVDHDSWLQKQGLHPEQRELAKAFNGTHKNSFPDLKVESKVPLGNNIPVKGGFRNGVLDNLHKESPATQAAILDKASRVDIGYNKGGLILVTPGMDPTTLGSKSRR